MKTVLHSADSRGMADHGWLQSRHTFSFASYYDPERTNFGMLRVLNDDVVAPGHGFDMHHHRNMEIISIPLEGTLEHRDNMGNQAVIRAGDVQVMSAGTGIMHSEYNQSRQDPVKFLQIWVIPRERGVTPRYQQITLDPSALKNRLHQIVSPEASGDGVWIHQDAWFHLGDLEAGHSGTYRLNRPDTHGVYAFVLEGRVTLAGHDLGPRDALGVWGTDGLDYRVREQTRLLIMEVPMD